MRALLVLALILTVGCGSSPTAPSPQPTPSPAPTPAPTFSGTVTDTVSGLPISGFSALLAGSHVTVSAPGYLTRDTRNGDVDLIPEAAPFSLAFYRQLVRNGYEAPGSLEPLRRLTVAPSIYLQTAGLSAATIASLKDYARQAVYDFSGRTMAVVTIEEGAELRPDRAGWITVEIMSGTAGATCGDAFVGQSAGHIRLFAVGCNRPVPHVLAHEIGHAMGFYHDEGSTNLMSATRPISHDGLASSIERFHAAIAYKRGPGNRDVDVDGATSSLARVVVD